MLLTLSTLSLPFPITSFYHTSLHQCPSRLIFPLPAALFSPSTSLPPRHNTSSLNSRVHPFHLFLPSLWRTFACFLSLATPIFSLFAFLSNLIFLMHPSLVYLPFPISTVPLFTCSTVFLLLLPYLHYSLRLSLSLPYTTPY